MGGRENERKEAREDDTSSKAKNMTLPAYYDFYTYSHARCPRVLNSTCIWSQFARKPVLISKIGQNSAS